MVSEEYDVLISKETTGTYSCSCTGNNNCDVIYVLDNFGCATKNAVEIAVVIIQLMQTTKIRTVFL